jgi:hypothetical protein
MTPVLLTYTSNQSLDQQKRRRGQEADRIKCCQGCCYVVVFPLPDLFLHCRTFRALELTVIKDHGSLEMDDDPVEALCFIVRRIFQQS